MAEEVQTVTTVKPKEERNRNQYRKLKETKNYQTEEDVKISILYK